MSPPELKSFLTKYYAYAFCYDLIFAYPVYAILFRSHGLSLLQVSFLMIWWSVCAGAFEVPSGALADTFSRRKLLTVAPLIKSLCFVLWHLADGSFFLYAAGFTMWSFGSSLVSGTQEAILYDSLTAANRLNEYEKARGRQRQCHRAACTIACMAGGMIAQYEIGLALRLSVLPPLIGAATAWSMVEPPRSGAAHDTRYCTHFKNAWRDIKSNPVLRYTFIYVLLGIGLLAESEEYNGLYWESVGTPLCAVGFLFALEGVVEVLGFSFGDRLKNYRRLDHIVPFLVGLLMLGVGAFPSRAMIPAMLLCYALVAPMEVVIDGRMQRCMSGESRATTTSFVGLFCTVVGLPLSLLFGYLSKTHGLGAGYMFFGVVMLAFSVWVARRSSS